MVRVVCATTSKAVDEAAVRLVSAKVVLLVLGRPTICYVSEVSWCYPP